MRVRLQGQQRKGQHLARGIAVVGLVVLQHLTQRLCHVVLHLGRPRPVDLEKDNGFSVHQRTILEASLEHVAVGLPALEDAQLVGSQPLVALCIFFPLATCLISKIVCRCLKAYFIWHEKVQTLRMGVPDFGEDDAHRILHCVALDRYERCFVSYISLLYTAAHSPTKVQAFKQPFVVRYKAVDTLKHMSLVP